MLKYKGFTLVELMITVAIVGILAAIALPSYQTYTLKTKRSDAKIGLLQMADSQERYYLQNNSYAATNTLLYGAAVKQSPENKYLLTVTSGGATGFVVSAAAQAEQVADTACLTLTYNQAGTKTPAACW